MIEIFNANEIQSPYTRWFFYGETGSGKTSAAATFPSPFFILPKNENSVLTLQGQDVPYTLIATRQDMAKVLAHLTERYVAMMRHLDAGNDDAAHEAFPWQTIVIENLSHYCELLVEDISRGGEQQMNQQLWGLLSNHLRNIHATLCDLDAHIVYTSLDTVDESGKGRPLMTGKNAIIMPSSCDVIVHCEQIVKGPKKETAYRANFTKSGSFPARSRFKSFPPFVDGFDFRDFESHFSGS